MRLPILIAAASLGLAGCQPGNVLADAPTAADLPPAAAPAAPAGGEAAGSPTATLTAADPETAGAADAARARELLVPLNQLRASKGLAALAWSDELETEVRRLADKSVAGTCSHSQVRRALAPHAADTIHHWTGAVRRLDGDAVRQGITARYAVSEWAMGAEDYDAVAGKCWTTGPCTSFAQIVRPEATQVACAYRICQGQEQIWICRFTP